MTMHEGQIVLKMEQIEAMGMVRRMKKIGEIHRPVKSNNT
jgi:hypothetical protein